MASLTDKQARFVEEYLIDLNATQAAIRAGYSEDTARQMGAENLSKPVIADAIAEAQKARSERTQVTADQVLDHLARIGLSDIRRIFTPDGQLKQPGQMDEATAACISSIEVVTRNVGGGEVEHVHKVRLWDKLSALDKIGKHLGMFVDRSEVKVQGDLSHLSDQELERQLEQQVEKMSGWLRKMGWVRPKDAVERHY